MSERTAQIFGKMFKKYEPSKPKPMNDLETWIGIGVKGGGSLVIGGVETLEGEVTNLRIPTDIHPVNVTNYRIGPGLGGGAGLVALIVYNARDLIQQLNGTSVQDVSFNFALAGKWDGVVKGMKNYKFLETMAKWGQRKTKLFPSEITDIRNMLSMLYSAGDMALRNDLPKLVSIDIPFAGAGLEVSLHYLGGIITIGELRHPEQQKEPEPSGMRRGSM